MAALNLTPDAGLVLTQAGIFLANLYVVKKLMLEPYIKLRDKRHMSTHGGQEEATKALQEVEAQSQIVNMKISQALEQAKAIREKSKSDAKTKQHEIVEKAKVESKSRLEAVSQDIKSNLEQEFKKVPDLVKSMTNEVFSAVLK